jgi:hypothetical protein
MSAISMHTQPPRQLATGADRSDQSACSGAISQLSVQRNRRPDTCWKPAGAGPQSCAQDQVAPPTLSLSAGSGDGLTSSQAKPADGDGRDPMAGFGGVNASALFDAGRMRGPASARGAHD